MKQLKEDCPASKIRNRKIDHGVTSYLLRKKIANVSLGPKALDRKRGSTSLTIYGGCLQLRPPAEALGRMSANPIRWSAVGRRRIYRNGQLEADDLDLVEPAEIEEDGSINGEITFHNGDESAFKTRRWRSFFNTMLDETEKISG